MPYVNSKRRSSSRRRRTTTTTSSRRSKSRSKSRSRKSKSVEKPKFGAGFSFGKQLIGGASFVTRSEATATATKIATVAAASHIPKAVAAKGPIVVKPTEGQIVGIETGWRPLRSTKKYQVTKDDVDKMAKHLLKVGPNGSSIWKPMATNILSGLGSKPEDIKAGYEDTRRDMLLWIAANMPNEVINTDIIAWLMPWQFIVSRHKYHVKVVEDTTGDKDIKIYLILDAVAYLLVFNQTSKLVKKFLEKVDERIVDMNKEVNTMVEKAKSTIFATSHEDGHLARQNRQTVINDLVQKQVMSASDAANIESGLSQFIYVLDEFEDKWYWEMHTGNKLTRFEAPEGERQTFDRGWLSNKWKVVTVVLSVTILVTSLVVLFFYFYDPEALFQFATSAQATASGVLTNVYQQLSKFATGVQDLGSSLVDKVYSAYDYCAKIIGTSVGGVAQSVSSAPEYLENVYNKWAGKAYTPSDLNEYWTSMYQYAQQIKPTIGMSSDGTVVGNSAASAAVGTTAKYLASKLPSIDLASLIPSLQNVMAASAFVGPLALNAAGTFAGV